MQYATLSSAIVSALSGLAGLKGVYAYDNPSPAGYPCACAYPQGNADTAVLDTSTDVHTCTFAARFYDAMRKGKVDECDARLLPLVDAALASLSTDADLRSGNIIPLPIVLEWGVVNDTPGNILRVCELTLRYKVPLAIS